MIVVGLDPGISNIGVAIAYLAHPSNIFSCTCHSSSLQSVSDRLVCVQQFFRELREKSDGLLKTIDYLVLERQPGKLHESISWATGVAIVNLLPVKVVHVTPRELKKIVTGSGCATKLDLRSFIEDRYKLDIINIDQHQVDAIGLVFAGIEKCGLSSI